MLSAIEEMPATLALVLGVSDNGIDATVLWINALVLGAADNVLNSAMPVLESLVACGLKEELV